MWVARVEEGFLFGDLTQVALETLEGVPMLIESSDPRVRGRLLPETCEVEEDEEHWREHAVPELERLFLSRAQVVQRDLDKLRKMIDGDSYSVPSTIDDPDIIRELEASLIDGAFITPKTPAK